jgi:hypothetical protein
MAEEATIEASVRTELRRLKATTTVEGRAAIALACQLDESGARDAAPLSRELRQVMTDLRQRFAAVKSDPVDELKARRRVRRSG